MDFWQEGDWIAGHDDRIECNSLFCRQTKGAGTFGPLFPARGLSLENGENANLTFFWNELQGKIYVRGDSKVFRFQNGKSESLFLQRKNPRRIAWTVLYRRQHKKGITEVRYCHNPPGDTNGLHNTPTPTTIPHEPLPSDRSPFHDE